MFSAPQSSPSRSFQITSSLRYDPSLPELLHHREQETAYPDPQATPYYLLSYHRDRLINSTRYFQWTPALEFLVNADLGGFSRVLDSFIPDRTKQWRLRILLDYNGECKVEANPTAPIPLLNLLVPQMPSSAFQYQEIGPGSRLWRVYIDSQSISPSALTTHKTTARDDYNNARLRVGIQSPAESVEVLVFNPIDEIMEGSITTPYFQRQRPWAPSLPGAMDGPQWITPPLSSGGNDGTTRRYALAQGFCVEQVIKTTDLVYGEECWLSNGVRGFMRGEIVVKRTDECKG